MIYCDNLIEYNALTLRNLNANAANTTSDWCGPYTGYGFYSVPYETALQPEHLYYRRFTYKFTTTNQSPTWAQFYAQGGSVGGPKQNNPVAGTSYTVSAIARPTYASENVDTGGCTRNSGTIYNGASNAISGVSSYVKEVLCYDVTLLYDVLKLKGLVTSESTLKTWCDNNLSWVAKGVDYKVFSDTTKLDKVDVFKGNIIADEFVEPDGMRTMSFSAGVTTNAYFDNANPISVYNNKGGGTVTHTRVDAGAQNSPFYPEHKYVLKITTSGEATPGAGGFYATHTAAANKVFIERFVAKVPVGYTVCSAYNSQGTGSSVTFITSNAGTGNWEEYAILYRCGSSGTFSSGGHVYLNGSNNTSVTWYLAYVNNCEITNNPDLAYYTVLPKKENVKKGLVFSNRFDETNELIVGDFKSQLTTLLPSGWTYDTTDFAGNSNVSLVQPVGKGAGTLNYEFPVEPGRRYRVSYWIKCSGDMTSFLSAAYFYDANGNIYNHTGTMYVAGTKAKLTAELKTGDTSMTVDKNTNWVSRNYAKVGFRSTQYGSGRNDIGISNGVSGTGSFISGKTGTNVVNFAAAYTGPNRPAGTYVVESYDGGNYPYPITKGQLPIDNTWKYVEGYVGNSNYDNTNWDGSDIGGITWKTTPIGAVKMYLCLNIYNNTGTVPIKYSDIRVEPVNVGGGNRLDKKIQIK